VTVAALHELDPKLAAKAIKKYELDADAPMPTTV
jgi:hypothetical protein